MQRNVIHNTDCVSGMAAIPDGVVDLVLTDLPYGITSCPWDSLLPLPDLWRQWWRVLKPNGAVVLTCAQPFTTTLIESCRRYFRYCWYWSKNTTTGFPFAKFQPLRCVEDVAVFYRRAPVYHPQGLVELEQPRTRTKRAMRGTVYRDNSLDRPYETRYTNYPRQLLHFPCERGLHPTQKPVALFEYFIRTYTNPGGLVLDCCMGSGTTKVACRNSGRDYIGFEIDRAFWQIAEKR